MATVHWYVTGITVSLIVLCLVISVQCSVSLPVHNYRCGCFVYSYQYITGSKAMLILLYLIISLKCRDTLQVAEE